MIDEACVLYVDPDPDTADRVTAALEAAIDRIAVQTAASATDGMDVLAGTDATADTDADTDTDVNTDADTDTDVNTDADIDCLITAFDLPDQDGLTFLKQVRADRPALPIILYPETGTDALVDDALAAGVTDYLTRAADTDRHQLLAHRIRQLLETGHRSTSGQDPSHRLFRRAVEASGHSIYFTDANGVIEYVNPAFEEMSGYSASEAVGMTPRILKSGEHSTAFYAELWDTILAGQTWRSEIINESKDGKRYIIDQTIAPVEDSNGKITHFVAINVDITETYEYEREIERQNERLDRFASVVSHDLRNPLNVAAGRLELAREDTDSAHHETIGEALDRMERIIDDMLWLAREGRRIGSREAVSLDAVAQRAWTLVADDTATATLVVRVADDRTIQADPDRLRQLLENLFRNAIEHGGEDVTVTVDVLDDGFSVADDGPGIPADQRDSVFEAGYSTVDDGTGFGLNIVKQIVEAHDWDIQVTDSDDGGANFEITGVELSSVTAPQPTN